MSNPSKMMKWMTLSLALTGALSACTQSQEYETLYKERVHSKDELDTTSEFLYAPSVLESLRTTDASRPNWLGEGKIVKFRFKEDAIEVIQVESDERFRDNDLNNKPVMRIPVQHIEYRCKENSAKECSNAEEENDEINWTQKSKFKPDFNGLDVKEVNFLPIELDNLFGNCHTPVGQELIGYRLENDALNIEIERTFKTSVNCASSWDLSDWSFKTRYFYSFVRLEKATSAKYQAVEYPRTDENTFGFFTTEQNRLSQDNRDEEAGVRTLMNRWNPDRKELVYHLTENFEKPEHAAIKKATIESVEAINRAFQEAGTDMHIVLKSGKGLRQGDLRHNFIVMVEDPVAAGLLGYGPSLANPRTGEIVYGRTVMYLGTIKSTVRNTYDEIIEELAAAPAEGEDAGDEGAGGQNGHAALKGLASKLDLTRLKAKAAGMIAAKSNAKTIKAPQFSEPQPAIAGPQLGGMEPHATQISKKAVREASRSIRNYRANAVKPENIKDRIGILSKYNITPAEAANIHDAVAKALGKELKDLPRRPWAELTDDEKNKVIEVLVPYVWTPTLVHELGHNMGLRHNFAGSEDKANFYTAEELHQHGMEENAKYSSIMDYSYRTLNELHMMGKYDVAALRFGYTRKVETADGQLVSVATTLKDLTKQTPLKRYEYCTDEHVGINAGCKRFDEGTNMTEIAQHLIQSYEEQYKLRNFRNGRRDFSIRNDVSYAARLDMTFFGLRTFFETADRIATTYGIPADHPIWKSDEFLADLDRAVTLGEEFMLKVIRTPDITCALALTENPNQVVDVVPLAQIDSGISCFHSKVQSLLAEYGLVAVAQGGKSFQSREDNDSDNPYADQIDLRGIWMDKVLATKYLVQRHLDVSLFDGARGVYADSRPGSAAKLMDLMNSILMDDLQGEVTFTAQDGSQFSVEIPYGLASTHRVPEPSTPSLAMFLDLPADSTEFSRIMAGTVLPQLKLKQPVESMGHAIAENFRAFKRIEGTGYSPQDFRVITLGKQRRFVLKGESSAGDLMDHTAVLRILEAANKRGTKEEHERLASLIAEAKKREKKKQTEGVPNGDAEAGKNAPKEEPSLKVTPEEERALELGSAVLERYAQGGFKSSQHYGHMLDILSDIEDSMDEKQSKLEKLLELTMKTESEK